MNATPMHIEDLSALFAVEGRARGSISRLITHSTNPHPDCLDQEFCGGFSQLARCLRCQGIEPEERVE